MSDFWDQNKASYPAAPHEPDAQVMEAQFRQVQHLLKRWRWTQHSRHGTVALVMFQDGLTMQLDLEDGQLHADIFSSYVPYDAQALTWILLHNFRRVWKARAAQPAKGAIQIYLGATFPLSRLDEVGQVLWEGWQEALTWKGQFEEREAVVENNEATLEA